jgi:hypothetical protein
MDFIMNTTTEDKILKALESFHEDIEWLKENTATKKDLVAEREHTRKIVREEIAVNNPVIGTVFKVELAEAKQDIVKGVNKGFQEIVVELKEQGQRIEILEEHPELKPRKN